MVIVFDESDVDFGELDIVNEVVEKVFNMIINFNGILNIWGVVGIGFVVGVYFFMIGVCLWVSIIVDGLVESWFG